MTGCTIRLTSVGRYDRCNQLSLLYKCN